jgi:uncharacterized protein (TIGR00266 family)
MNYRIEGNVMEILTMEMEGGEEVYSEAGAMVWMTGNVKMKTETGGVGLVLKRMGSGESIFINKFRAENGPGSVTFANEIPGRIIDVHLEEGENIIAQKDAFLAAESSVRFRHAFTKSIGFALFGGEGFVFQKFEGPGHVFMNLEGYVNQLQLGPGD